MPYAELTMQPGIDVEKTPLLNSAGFSESAAIRFFEGLPEKIGGWEALNNGNPLIGICTGLHAWADLSGRPYIAAGTDQRLQLFYGGLIYDITPLRTTKNATPDFTTVFTSKTVTVHDVAHGALVGDWINITIPVAVGGIVLQGFYLVQSVPDADHYTITIVSPALSSASGGAVPTFTTVATSANVTVALVSHGYSAGDLFAVQVATTVGGITIAAGSYNITSALTNSFVIVPAGVAASSATASENGGNAQIAYLIPSGAASASYTVSSGAYGAGAYGSGVYGGTTGTATAIPVRQWFEDNFGQDGIFNYTGSPIYVWTPPPEPNNVAVPIDTINFPGAQQPPQQVLVSFVSAPQQQIIALGCDEPFTHVFDPLLVRWCDVSDFTNWIAASTNQAGSYRIPTGSRLIGGVRAPNFITIWTDVDMWTMSYLGAGLVWGFEQISRSANLLCARGVVVYGSNVFWVSSNGFYAWDGGNLQLIPCPVWDIFWNALDRSQVDKVNAQSNSWFQEVSWAFPSTTGNGEVDSRITLNIREGSWTFDRQPTVTARTAWIDANVYGAPIGTDNDGLLQQHEQGYDANGSPLNASVRTGWFSLSEGSYLMMMERVSVDAKSRGGDQTLYITIDFQDYPSGPVRTFGPYAYVPGSGPPYSIVRGRGRFARVALTSTSKGVFWRMGRVRFMSQQAGRNP